MTPLQAMAIFMVLMLIVLAMPYTVPSERKLHTLAHF